MKKMYLICLMLIMVFFSDKNVYATGIADNLDYSFTTTEGGTVTTKADGKPKILVFFMPTCGPCNRLFQDITDNAAQYSSYDILAIDVTGSSIETISLHKKKFGQTPVVFCADDNYSGFDYKYKLEASLTIGTPYSVFIDRNNKIVGYNEGYSNDYNKVTSKYFPSYEREIKDEEPVQPTYCNLTKVKKLKFIKKKNGIKLSWNKIGECVTGYQVQYSKDKKFKKNVSSVYIQESSYIIKKKRKSLYIRVRGYINNNGKYIYGKWVTKKI